MVPISRQWRVTLAVMLATAMQAFDATIVNVALPQLERSLDGGIELGSWVVTSYLCAAAVTALLTGPLRRRYGPVWMFAGATGAFVAASLLCATAASPLVLICSRLLQGAAGGVIPPLAQATLLDIHPTEQHGRILALWGAAIMAGPVFGPLLGGVITDLASWRWIFLVNLPLGALAIWGLRQIPAPSRSPHRAPVDTIGMLLLAIGVAALQLSLDRSIGRDWLHSPELLADAALVLLAFTTLGIRAIRIEFAVLKVEVFCNLNFVLSIFYNFMVSFLLFATIVFVPALGEGPLNYSATAAGGIIAPRAIATMGTMLVVGPLINRMDPRLLLAAGLTLTAAAFGAMAHATYAAAGLELAVAGVVQGLGAGLLFTPLSFLAYSTLSPGLRADAAGIYMLLRQLGSAAGVAIMTAVLHHRIGINLAHLAAHPAMPHATPARLVDLASFRAYADSFQVMAAISVIIVPGVILFRILRQKSGLRKAV